MRTKNELYQQALRTVAMRRQTARANAEDARLEAEAAIPALRHAEDEVRVRGIRCALAGAAGVALGNMDSPGCMGAQEIGFSTSGVAGDTLGDILRRCTGQAEVVIRPLGRGSDLSFFGPRISIQVS